MYGQATTDGHHAATQLVGKDGLTLQTIKI